MREGIHPEYTDAQITCACGHTVETRSTKGSYKVDICGACHPFYTGKQRQVRAAGRVEKFNRKYKRG